MTALCLVRRGFDRDLVLLVSAGTDTTVVRMSLEALERDILHVLVLAVVAEPDESFLELDRFESWEVFLVTSHDEPLRLGSRRRSGIPQ
jgi:hypothetical protein